MIVFVVASGHEYTFRALRTAKGAPPFRIVSYYRLFGSARLPMAAYVFTDFDRLSAWELRLAGDAFRLLSAAGCPCLSNPAKALGRFALLRRLHDEGVNDFNAWHLEAGERPTRFPVFVRSDDGHAGPLTDLLADQAALDKSVERLTDLGFPVSRLIAVEYAAEPIRAGMFRKYSMFRVGAAVFNHAGEHGPKWQLKTGAHGAAGEALYRQELEEVRAGAFREALQRAFRISGVDYGRADFGLVDGRPQIYEINSNPLLDREPEARDGSRRETVDHFWENLLGALRRIGAPHLSAVVALDSPLLKLRRRRQRWYRPRERYGVRP